MKTLIGTLAVGAVLLSAAGSFAQQEPPGAGIKFSSSNRMATLPGEDGLYYEALPWSDLKLNVEGPGMITLKVRCINSMRGGPLDKVMNIAIFDGNSLLRSLSVPNLKGSRAILLGADKVVPSELNTYSIDVEAGRRLIKIMATRPALFSLSFAKSQPLPPEALEPPAEEAAKSAPQPHEPQSPLPASPSQEAPQEQAAPPPAKPDGTSASDSEFMALFEKKTLVPPAAPAPQAEQPPKPRPKVPHVPGVSILAGITAPPIPGDDAVYFALLPSSELKIKVESNGSLALKMRAEIEIGKPALTALLIQVYDGPKAVASFEIPRVPSPEFADRNDRVVSSTAVTRKLPVSSGDHVYSFRIPVTAKYGASVSFTFEKSPIEEAAAPPPKKEEPAPAMDMVPLIPLKKPPAAGPAPEDKIEMPPLVPLGGKK